MTAKGSDTSPPPPPASLRARHPAAPVPARARLGWRVLLLIVLAAFAARAAWGVWRLADAPDPAALEFPDEEQYWLMASNLWSGEGLRDELGFRATRMPLYPALLAPATALPHGPAVAKALQWLVGALAAGLTAALAARLAGRAVGIAAGLLVAFDPFLIFFSSLLLTETATVTALAGLWLVVLELLHRRHESGRSPRIDSGHRITSDPPASFQRFQEFQKKVKTRSWFVAGSIAAVAVYMRESNLGLISALFLFVAIVRRFRPETLAGIAIAVAVMALSLVPWAWRNQQVIGEWHWLTTRAGVSLYDGVRPGATGASDLAEVQQSPEVANLSELAWNRHFLDRSFAVMRDDPSRVARLAASKLARMWNPLPNVDTYQSRLVRTVSALWMLPIYILALAGVCILPRIRQDAGVAILLLLLPAIYLSIVHSFFVGSVRYRLPAMPMIETLAAIGLVAGLRAVRRFRSAE